MKNLLIILSTIFLIQCNSTGSMRGNRGMGKTLPAGMPNEPGKCYAKCMMPSQYETKRVDLFVYTGEKGSEDIVLEEVEIELVSPSSKWVKKKSPQPCRSRNPEDCLVWCLEKTEGEYLYETVVVDTTQTKNFKIKSYEYSLLVEEGGFTEWQEVICQKDITPIFIKQVHLSLQSKGYEVDGDNKLGSKTKASLAEFQKANQLPTGQLDIKTLTQLGVTF